MVVLDLMSPMCIELAVETTELVVEQELEFPVAKECASLMVKRRRVLQQVLLVPAHVEVKK